MALIYYQRKLNKSSLWAGSWQGKGGNNEDEDSYILLLKGIRCQTRFPGLHMRDANESSEKAWGGWVSSPSSWPSSLVGVVLVVLLSYASSRCAGSSSDSTELLHLVDDRGRTFHSHYASSQIMIKVSLMSSIEWACESEIASGVVTGRLWTNSAVQW